MTLADIIGRGPQLYAFDGTDATENGGTPSLDSAISDEIVEVDVTLSEQIDRGADVTRNPVERGIDVVDHKRIRPIALRMSGIVSDSPNNALDLLAGNTAGLPGSTAVKRSDDAYKRLTKLFEKTDPITIVTAREVFRNMTIETYSVHKNDAGEYLGFDCTMSELRFATTATVGVVVAPDVAPVASAPPVVQAPANPIDAAGSIGAKLVPILNKVPLINDLLGAVGF